MNDKLSSVKSTTFFKYNPETKKLECTTKTEENDKDIQDDCAYKLIAMLNAFLKMDTPPFYDDGTLIDIIRKFLQIFSISDLNDKTIEDLNDRIVILQQYLDEILAIQKGNIYVDIKNVYTIFDKCGTECSKLSIINWSSVPEMPVCFVPSSISIEPEEEKSVRKLIDIFEHTAFKIRKIPDVCNNHITLIKCDGMKSSFFNDFSSISKVNKEIVNMMHDVDKLTKMLPFFSSTGYGEDTFSCDDIKNNDNDECIDEFAMSSKNYKRHYALTMYPAILETIASCYGKIVSMLLTAMYELDKYAELHDKVCKINKLYSDVVFRRKNKELPRSRLLSSVVIMTIDYTFLLFVRDLFSNQMEINELDFFTIERVLLNITNYYIDHHINYKRDEIYLNIQYQDDNIKMSLMLLVTLVCEILCDISKFTVPVSFLYSVCMPVVIGMTNRTHVTCANEQIANTLVSNLLEYTSYGQVNMFTSKYVSVDNSKNNIKVTDMYGNTFTVFVDSNIEPSIIICEKIQKETATYNVQSKCKQINVSVYNTRRDDTPHSNVKPDDPNEASINERRKLVNSSIVHNTITESPQFDYSKSVNYKRDGDREEEGDEDVPAQEDLHEDENIPAQEDLHEDENIPTQKDLYEDDENDEGVPK